MATFTLELLHIADQEASTGAIVDAPNLTAVLTALRDQDLGDDGLADNTLTLSSGDAFIPSVFFDASEAVFGTAGIGDIQIQNELGIQAIALGNHEFDRGPDLLAALISGDATGDFSALTGSTLEGLDFGGTLFPYLSTNLDFSTEASLAPLEVDGGLAPQGNVVTSSTIIDVNGEAIAVVGATTPTLGAISNPGDVRVSPSPFDPDPTPGQLDALAAEIQAEVDAILAANPGLDKVILLAHMQQISIEQALATRLSDVDIVVAGGSNTRLFDNDDRARDGDSDQGVYPIFETDADGNPVAVVNTDGSYKYVGRLVIDFDEDGVIVPESYDPSVSGAYATDAQGVADLSAGGLIDPEIQAIVDAIEAQIIASESNVFGISDVYLNGNRSGTGEVDDPDGVRTQETNLGNLTADANLAEAKKADPTVVISLKNGGGIRDDIGDDSFVAPGSSEVERVANPELRDGDGNLIKPEGGISQTDIQSVLAFNNDLVLLTLTKEEIVGLLEHGVAALPDVSGRFPQIAGLEFSFDPEQNEGSQIQNAMIVGDDGQLIATLVEDGAIAGDPAEAFRVVTLGFLAAPRFDDETGAFTGGGDGYPFPNLNTDPAAGQLGDPDAIARVNFQGLEQEGVQTGEATFADDGTEQDALAEFLAANFNDGETFGETDTGPGIDGRIQNLAFRSDTVGAADGTGELEVALFQRFDSPFDPEDEDSPEGASEVVAYEDGRVYTTNGNLDQVDIFDLPASGSEIPAAPSDTIDLSTLPGFDGVQSLAVKDGILAVAVDVAPVEDGDNLTPSRGLVAFYDTATLALIEAVEVGFLPDQVAFSPDGLSLSVANEGEFNGESDLTENAPGTVSLVAIDRSGATPGFTVTEVDFDGVAVPDDVRIGSSFDFPLDAEPEYTAFSPDGSQVFAVLQENNALAVIDVATGQVVEVRSLGTLDHSLDGNGLDPNDRDDAINIRSFDDLVGLRMPDAFVTFEKDGETFIATANEGDGRGDYFVENDDGDIVGVSEFGDEVRVGDLLDVDGAFGAVRIDASVDTAGLGRLTISALDGDTDGDGDIDVLHAYGSRSFTIFDGAGNVVFDSGDQFSRIVADIAPERFQDDDDTFNEDRADNKGVEPEAIEVGEINGQHYAFIGLERDSGIMIYNISDPANAYFVDYIDGVGTGNISPEILEFVPASESPSGTSILLASYEVSGTTVAYEISIPDGVTVDGGNGRQEIGGTAGNDSLSGGNGADILNGDAGNDLLDAGRGRDIVNGGEGNDILLGAQGRDTMDGGAGDDTLDGARGRDTLDGGGGDDIITGGAGRDTFRFAADFGDDVVMDLTSFDTVEIVGATLGDVVLADQGDDVLATISGGATFGSILFEDREVDQVEDSLIFS